MKINEHFVTTCFFIQAFFNATVFSRGCTFGASTPVALPISSIVSRQKNILPEIAKVTLPEHNS